MGLFPGQGGGRMKKWYRCAYKTKHIKSNWPDGFARTHWTTNEKSMNRMVRATEEFGGEAFIEEKIFTNG